MTTATISRAQKVKMFREAAREGLEKKTKKIKATFSKKVQKPTLGQNVRIKIPDIYRAKMDPKSIIAVVTDIKNYEFYELGTELVTNKHIKEIMGVKEKPDIIDIIEKKSLQWYGHVKRMQEERLPKLIMEWIAGERRKRGRPRKM
jgi:polyphosphate kinase